MTRLIFQAGQTQREGRDFKEKLALDCQGYAELVMIGNVAEERVYNLAEDGCTLYTGWYIGHVGEGIETENVILTRGEIVGRNPRRALSRLEKLTGIKLTETKDKK